MILYHGSNVQVKEPQIIESKRYLDFGIGFYLTSDFEQAQKWAVRKTNLTDMGKPTISVFDFDETAKKELRVLTFTSATKEWLYFIAKNRKGEITEDRYDLIIGPVANDNVIKTVNNYLSGYLPAEIAIQLLLTQRLKDQFTFKNEKSLHSLLFKESIII